LASARAIASPMPEVEPVTSAVLPFNMAVLVTCGHVAEYGGWSRGGNLLPFLLHCNI
jgi:hypothetical protein